MNYSVYKFSRKEIVFSVLQMMLFSVLVAKLFYGKYAYTILFVPLYFGGFQYIRKRKLERRNSELKIQFKDAILSMADLLNIGYSIENSIREIIDEMSSLHGRDSYICVELREIEKKIAINVPIENAIEEFAERSCIQEIRLFAQALHTAKRTGGNINTIIKLVADTISMNFHVQEEINVAIGEKKLEQKVMSFVPLAIVLYVYVTSPGFFDVMYDTILGNVIMTGCLIGYFVSMALAEKIMAIDM